MLQRFAVYGDFDRRINPVLQDDRDYRKLWIDFISACEHQIAELQRYLAPLEAGNVRTQKRSPETGGILKDTTADDIATIKREIAEIEAVIRQHRHRAE